MAFNGFLRLKYKKSKDFSINTDLKKMTFRAFPTQAKKPILESGPKKWEKCFV